MFKLKKNKNKHQDTKVASANLIISEQQQNNEITVSDKKVNLEVNNEVDNKKAAKKGECENFIVWLFYCFNSVIIYKIRSIKLEPSIANMYIFLFVNKSAYK